MTMRVCAAVPMPKNDRTKGKQRNWIFICMFFFLLALPSRFIIPGAAPAPRFPSIGVCRGAFFFHCFSAFRSITFQRPKEKRFYLMWAAAISYEHLCVFVLSVCARVLWWSQSAQHILPFSSITIIFMIIIEKFIGENSQSSMCLIKWLPHSQAEFLSTPALFLLFSSVAYSIYFICKYFLNVYVFISSWKLHSCAAFMSGPSMDGRNRFSFDDESSDNKCRQTTHQKWSARANNENEKKEKKSKSFHHIIVTVHADQDIVALSWHTRLIKKKYGTATTEQNQISSGNSNGDSCGSVSSVTSVLIIISIYSSVDPVASNCFCNAINSIICLFSDGDALAGKCQRPNKTNRWENIAWMGA